MQGLVATLPPPNANCADNLRARSRKKKKFLHAACSLDAQRGGSFSPAESLRASDREVIRRKPLKTLSRRVRTAAAPAWPSQSRSERERNNGVVVPPTLNLWVV